MSVNHRHQGMRCRRHRLSRPNGPSSLSPGHRPGFATRGDRRPEGLRYGSRPGITPPDRTPLGRRMRGGADPGRCPGLRNPAPLALKRVTMRHEEEIAAGRKELEGLLG